MTLTTMTELQRKVENLLCYELREEGWKRLDADRSPFHTFGDGKRRMVVVHDEGAYEYSNRINVCDSLTQEWLDWDGFKTWLKSNVRR
jgi:hypothetical protein